MNISKAQKNKTENPTKYQMLLKEPTAEQKMIDAINGGTCILYTDIERENCDAPK